MIPEINSSHGSETRNIINAIIKAINDRGLEILSESAFLNWLDENGVKHQGEWDNTKGYDRLSVVLHEGNSYTSIKRVPVRIDILNKEFWSLTGNYNAQVEYYREETERVAKDLISRSINVKNPPYPLIGVKNDGSNETEIIQNIIDYAHENNYNEVFFPSGEYYVEADKHRNHSQNHIYSYGLILKSNTVYNFSKNAILKAIPTGHTAYSILAIIDTENVTVNGGQFHGEKFDHLEREIPGGSKGEWGNCITVRESSNVHIKNIFTRDSWGDGIYVRNTLGYQNVVIENCIITDARRHELGIIECDGIKIINNSIYKTSSKLDDINNIYYGGLNIDLEGNTKDQYIKDVLIMGNIFDSPVNTAVRVESYSTNINITFRDNIINKNDVNNALSFYFCEKLLVENNLINNESGGEGLCRITDSVDVIFRNNSLDGGRGLFVSDCVNVIITENPIIKNSSAQSILLDNVNNFKINYNILLRNGTGAAELRNMTTISISYCKNGAISGNDVIKSNYSGFFIENSEKINLTGNNFINFETRNEIRNNCEGIIVTSNNIKPSEILDNHAIRVSNSSLNIISNNTITGNNIMNNGVLLTSSPDNILIGNIVTDTSGSGILAHTDSSSSIIENNLYL